MPHFLWWLRLSHGGIVFATPINTSFLVHHQIFSYPKKRKFHICLFLLLIRDWLLQSSFYMQILVCYSLVHRLPILYYTDLYLTSLLNLQSPQHCNSYLPLCLITHHFPSGTQCPKTLCSFLAILYFSIAAWSDYYSCLPGKLTSLSTSWKIVYK